MCLLSICIRYTRSVHRTISFSPFGKFETVLVRYLKRLLRRLVLILKRIAYFNILPGDAAGFFFPSRLFFPRVFINQIFHLSLIRKLNLS